MLNLFMYVLIPVIVLAVIVAILIWASDAD